MKSQFNIFHNVDKPVIILYLILVSIGWLSIYSADFIEGQSGFFSLQTSYGRQLLFILTAILAAGAILMINARFFYSFSRIIYAIAILLLVSIFLAGVEINATRAWFRIGGFAIQPSEFAKYATALALAAYISNIRTKKPTKANIYKSIVIVLIPALLTLMQKDVGTTLVFSAFVFALYREGWISGIVLFMGGLAVTLFILTMIFNEFIIIGVLASITLLLMFFLRKRQGSAIRLIGLFVLLSVYVYSVDLAFENILQAHHKSRIEVLIYGDSDLQGAGYNLHQSKIAIGSGGFWGKGFLQGTQTQFNFIPEQTTDFIFCTIGEEWGFVGSITLIGLFLALLLRLIALAERQKSSFSRVYAYSVVSVLFVHFAINIGMTIGLVPVIGIPLPFISYGGSSLWAMTLMLFTLLKLDAERLEMT